MEVFEVACVGGPFCVVMLWSIGREWGEGMGGRRREEGMGKGVVSDALVDALHAEFFIACTCCDCYDFSVS